MRGAIHGTGIPPVAAVAGGRCRMALARSSVGAGPSGRFVEAPGPAAGADRRDLRSFLVRPQRPAPRGAGRRSFGATAALVTAGRGGEGRGFSAAAPSAGGGLDGAAERSAARPAAAQREPLLYRDYDWARDDYNPSVPPHFFELPSSS